jgi:hypothetical protein
MGHIKYHWCVKSGFLFDLAWKKVFENQFFKYLGLSVEASWTSWEHFVNRLNNWECNLFQTFLYLQIEFYFIHFKLYDLKMAEANMNNKLEKLILKKKLKEHNKSHVLSFCFLIFESFDHVLVFVSEKIKNPHAAVMRQFGA